MTDTLVKICGLREPEHLEEAIRGGARFVGFVFHPSSPRAVSIDTATMLCRHVPAGVKTVGLFVDPSDKDLEDVMGRVPVDIIQLHGGENTARTAEIKETYAVPIIKAFPVSREEDLAVISAFDGIADWFLMDAKTKDSTFGGGGEPFDWTILKDCSFSTPWMLAGGLTPENVGEAIALLHPNAVDVSSGVEITRGQKSSDKIKAFLKAVRTCTSG